MSAIENITVPFSIAYYKEIIDERNEALQTNPDILNEDWSDNAFLQANADDLMELIAGNSLAPVNAVTLKVENSSLAVANKWMVDTAFLISEIDKLEHKYPNFPTDMFFYMTFVYISYRTKLSVYNAIFKGKKFDYGNKIRHYYLQRRKSPKTFQKNIKLFYENVSAFKNLREKNGQRNLDKSLGKGGIGGFIDNTLLKIQLSLFIHKYGRVKGHKIMTGLFEGDSFTYMRLMSLEKIDKIHGENQFYCDLFPLFRHLLKDKNLLSKEEYNDDMPYRSYHIYMVAKVKIALGLR